MFLKKCVNFQHTNLKKCERLNHVPRYPVHPSSAAPHDTKFSKTYLNKDRKVSVLFFARISETLALLFKSCWLVAAVNQTYSLMREFSRVAHTANTEIALICESWAIEML